MSTTVLFARISLVALALLVFSACRASAQDAPLPPAGPADTLTDILTAACTRNESQFAHDLTSDSATAFRALTTDQRTEFMKRFSLSEEKGRPLLSSDAQNHNVLRCEGPSSTTEFRFGAASVHENLAFIPVSVVGGQETKFGLVREGGGWKVISVGLLLVDIPSLSKQWANDEVAQHEDAVVEALAGLRQAVERYKNAFGKLPDSLEQLGPANAGQISPDKASLVGPELASGAAGGYRFTYRVVATADPNSETFELAATPEEYGRPGRRSFFVDGAGRIHAADKHGTAATSDDPELETETARP